VTCEVDRCWTIEEERLWLTLSIIVCRSCVLRIDPAATPALIVKRAILPFIRCFVFVFLNSTFYRDCGDEPVADNRPETKKCGGNFKKKNCGGNSLSPLEIGRTRVEHVQWQGLTTSV
jgi:hypothetical protein